MSFKISVKIPQTFLKKVSSLRQEAALVTVHIVEAVFVKMLKTAPQYSGNFVANMAITGGTSMGRQGGDIVFPIPDTDAEAVAQGSTDAIKHAMDNSIGMAESLTRSITFKSGWIPSLTIYNRLGYAEDVEAWGEENLRDENKGGAHVMAQAEGWLREEFGTPIVYESPKWYSHLVGSGGWGWE